MGEDSRGQSHKRRERYPGKYPRRFDQRYKELDPERWPEVSARIREKGGTPAGSHVPVLLAEVLEALRVKPGDVVCDCTLGYGGHAAELARRVGSDGVVVGMDVDGVELARTRARLEQAGLPVRSYHANFAALAGIAAREAPSGFDAILADLGVSSMQVDDPSRGFSVRRDGPLDMRMDPRLPRTAADLLAALSTEELEAALRDLADEPDAAAIARAVVMARLAGRPLRRTLELVSLVFHAKGIDPRRWRREGGVRQGMLHPAARTFQALRLLVNDEQGALIKLLNSLPRCLRPGGRVAVISFHSGEDRLVKHSFRDGLRGGVYSEVSPDPIRPSLKEVRANPRAASAKLRWAVRARG